LVRHRTQETSSRATGHAPVHLAVQIPIWGMVLSPVLGPRRVDKFRRN
jgi:hypothetical protein